LTTDGPTLSDLVSFVDDYIGRRRKTLKPNTIRNLTAAADELKSYFGATRRLDTVTTADAKNFRIHLVEKGLGQNTVNRTIGRAKQFWLAARDAELIQKNPFAGQDCQVRPVEERFEYIDRATIDKVLDACVDQQWRLIVALCRLAGLRCPSEVLQLKWSDVNGAEHKMLVASPKLEHHAGGGQRWVPIFKELQPILDAAFHQAAKGDVYCITRYRDTNANLRTQLGRFCKAAGVPLWG
jgi:integrase